MNISEVGLNLIKDFEGASISDNALDQAEESVTKLVTAPVNQNQFDALVSFVANMGFESFRHSLLLSRINNLEDPYQVALTEFPKLNKQLGKVSNGLSRRRSRELDLFCHPIPEYKWGWVSITSCCRTYFKKKPVNSFNLTNEEKALVKPSRLYRRCQVLDRSANHTYLNLGQGLGDWWVVDSHWKGLKDEIDIPPYAVDHNLLYLRNFPYYHEPSDSVDLGHSICVYLCLKYYDVKNLETFEDYSTILSKYGKHRSKRATLACMEELGFKATNTLSADEDLVKSELRKGKPVVARFSARRHYTKPGGHSHFVVITGYDNDSWLVQDPFGEVDLVNGFWKDRGADSGRNARYNFELFNRRFFFDGGATGHCWVNFRNLD
jgi:GH24 family phage-related lysozyme (muramidase)